MNIDYSLASKTVMSLKSVEDALKADNPELITEDHVAQAISYKSVRCLNKILEVNPVKVFQDILKHEDTKFCVKFFRDNYLKFGTLSFIMFPADASSVNQKTLKLVLTIYNKEIVFEKTNNIELISMFKSFDNDTWYTVCKWTNESVFQGFINNLAFLLTPVGCIKHTKNINPSDFLLRIVKNLQLILTKTIRLNYKSIYLWLNSLFEKFDKYFIDQQVCLRVYLEMYDFLECVKNMAKTEKIDIDMPRVNALKNYLNKYLINDLVNFVIKYL
jgi:hypothetical protein